MKVSFYILQENEQGERRELPFLTVLDCDKVLFVDSVVFLSRVQFCVSKIELKQNFVKALCVMKYANTDEHIDQTFHCFDQIY